jgi:tRNA-2-methylthio-N6-dimethylallyladenosine synthase
MKNLYIHTIGCQMNVYDSEQMGRRLASLNYQVTQKLHQADLILVNTCAIRDKAEQKVFSYLGRLAGLKRKNKGLIIGVGGCVAQQEGHQMLKRVPHLDLVFGTHAIGRLPILIQQIEQRRCRLVDIEMTGLVDAFVPECEIQPNGTRTSSFVTIMQGCDNFCAYCVVPHVRGRETSRSPESIIREIEASVTGGVREVTLLGQNVNSYGKKEGLLSFVQLLNAINQIEGLQRIRFTTSHPKDLSQELVEAFQRIDKLCHHIHLPVQSGANRILKRMNRRYTREQYLQQIKMLREACPDIAISSDFIVGFPGETETDFQDTLDLIKEVEYDSLFAFIYSDRPNAPASRFSDKLPQQVKKDRLQCLLALQEQNTVKKNQKQVGSTQLILVDGRSKRHSAAGKVFSDMTIEWTGRTTGNKIVNFIPDEQMGPVKSGQLVQVKIERALSHSLWGKPIAVKPDLSNWKGDSSYAA